MARRAANTDSEPGVAVPARQISSDTDTDYKAEDNIYQRLDRHYNGLLARSTLGVSPASLVKIGCNWWAHWLLSPGKQLQSLEKAAKKTLVAWRYAWLSALNDDCEDCIAPLQQDSRFADPAWQHWPFNVLHQSFLLTQQWWHITVTDVRGVPPDDNRVVSFVARQMLDTFSPSNFFFSNPEVLDETYRERGVNLWRGLTYWWEDAVRTLTHERPAGADAYRVGRDVAITPGAVIFRNELIELIQYAPQTEQVYREPILIVPAWIMKYYILDLSPHNSLVRYLVEQGHTVFIISWKNPTAADRELSMEDYRRLGVCAALDTVHTVCGDARVHTMGYCLGGTMLAIALAALAQTDSADNIASMTLLATEVDFTQPGELGLFISESEIAYLETLMERQGFLDAKQMVGAFQLLRSNDLIWSRMLHEYLLGKRQHLNDLMAWNTDLTRMPFRMHSEYLRKLFLENQLARDQYEVNGKPIDLHNIRAPIFCVGTERDHVAPWRSVYKIHHYVRVDVTFLLTSGGHNVGIVNPIDHPHSGYRIKTTAVQDRSVDPDSWLQQAQSNDGSWWPALQQWLVQHSSKKQIAARVIKEEGVLEAAPGSYVLQI